MTSTPGPRASTQSERLPLGEGDLARLLRRVLGDDEQAGRVIGFRGPFVGDDHRQDDFVRENPAPTDLLGELADSRDESAVRLGCLRLHEVDD